MAIGLDKPIMVVITGYELMDGEGGASSSGMRSGMCSPDMPSIAPCWLR